MARLRVTRLLQDPLGAHAPRDERGDIVRVSDGRASVYLDPDEYDDLDDDTVRMMLSRVIPTGRAHFADSGKAPGRIASSAPAGIAIRPIGAQESGPLTTPRAPRE